VTTKRVTAVFKVCINLNLRKIARSRVWISTSTRFTTTSGKMSTLDSQEAVFLDKTCQKTKIKRHP
jgi:hypothetical protein